MVRLNEMIAIDTNVLVRYVINDEPSQAKLAKELFRRGHQVFIAKTVILELEWVLRAVYQQPSTVIYQGILKLLGLPKVVVEDRPQILQALSHYQQGMDFADALHLAASPVQVEFYTFDQKLVKVAGRVSQAVVLVKD